VLGISSGSSAENGARSLHRLTPLVGLGPLRGSQFEWPRVGLRVRSLLVCTTTAASLGLVWLFCQWSQAVADTTHPATKDNGLDFFILQLPGGATRVMFYVMAGIIIVVSGTLIGLVVYRPPHKDSGCSRQR